MASTRPVHIICMYAHVYPSHNHTRIQCAANAHVHGSDPAPGPGPLKPKSYSLLEGNWSIESRPLSMSEVRGNTFFSSIQPLNLTHAYKKWKTIYGIWGQIPLYKIGTSFLLSPSNNKCVAEYCTSYPTYICKHILFFYTCISK